MRALGIATSLCLTSTVVLAQSASKTIVSLDTCFKLARVTEASCSAPANDAAQRQECLQNARKVQIECLELAGTQAPAPVDRPPAAADAVSPDKPAVADKPVGAEPPVVATGAIPSPGAIPAPSAVPSPGEITPVNPVAAAPADQGESQSAKTSAAAPSEKSSAATLPGVANASAPVPSVKQGSGWTVSETSSPVDYSPLVTAAILARSETKTAPTALVVGCRGRRTELGLRMEGAPLATRGGDVRLIYQINDLPTVKQRWTASADGKTVNYREDAVALLQSFSEDARLKVIVPDGSGRDSEASFQLAGWNVVRDKIATACKWTSAASKSSERR